jgi:hypothetical protein
MKPAIGVWTESAILALRASFPNSSAPRIVHPEATLEVDLAGGVLAFLQDLDRVRG